jgi:hypothetical protein
MSELKPITVTDECGSYSVYSKSDVDTAIEEKDRTIEFAKALTLKDIEIIKKKDKEIEELKDKLRWRKFPDEKPNEDTKFIVVNEKGFIQCCYYSPILKEFQIPVTYWMPLPSDPNEVK